MVAMKHGQEVHRTLNELANSFSRSSDAAELHSASVSVQDAWQLARQCRHSAVLHLGHIMLVAKVRTRFLFMQETLQVATNLFH